MENIVVLVTASSAEEARKIAQGLLNDEAAACVNIVANIESYFRWEGKVDSAREHLLIIKTTRQAFEKVKNTVMALHSYDVPEVIALSIVEGSASYLKWIQDSIKDS